MEDRSLERLNEFRAESAALQKPSRINHAARIALVAIAVAAGLWGVYVTVSSKIARANTGPDTDQIRQLAVYFENKHLYGAAIDAYGKYLDRAALPNDARANVCFSVGKLACEQEKYETALAYLYEAEMLAPDSNLKDEINKKVVLCLDKLGKPSELRRELNNRASAHRTAKDVGPDEVILAEIGDSVITNRDLDREINKLSPGAKQAFSSPEKKIDFLKSMISQRVLLDKALRQELDKDPAVMAELASERDSLVIQKLLDDAVRSKVTVTPEDAERYYKAKPDQFKPANGGEVPTFAQVKDQAMRQLETQKTQEMTRAYIDQVAREANVKVYADRLVPKTDAGK